MDKKNWGITRVCLGCGTRFYDFNKSPIICPSCGDVYDAEYLSKRKSKPISEKEEDDDIIIDDDIITEDDDIVSLDEESEDSVVSLDEDDSKE